MRAFTMAVALAALALAGCNKDSGETTSGGQLQMLPENPDAPQIPDIASVATFGGGCFWCVEEVFHQTRGVLSAVSGYMGGKEETAQYLRVGSGTTNHAEVVQVHFDPAVISYEELLDVFFHLHDPTQLNRQGPDQGRQYRSVVFYHNDLQKLAADAAVKRYNEENTFGDTVVTEVSEAPGFYPAEEKHQNFARRNPGHPYLRAHLYPKLEKLGLVIPVGTKAEPEYDLKGSHSNS